MAYVPPHKRHSKDKERLLPSPELPPPQTHNSRMKSSNSHAQTNPKIVYAKQFISKWFAVGFHDHDHDDGDDENQLPPYVQLHPISLEFVERKFGDKPLILVYSDTDLPQTHGQGTQARSPWEVVVDEALQHLISSFENVRSEMEVQNLELEQVKPALVARFGKILFHGGPSVTQEAMRKNLAAGTMLRQLNRTFYTNIPTSYMQKMTKEESLKVGLDFTEEKDLYHVKLSDANRPKATISCKCSIMKEQNKLQLYKIELNQVRHMVTDISCLTKNLDLRLMLCSKRILTVLKSFYPFPEYKKLMRGKTRLKKCKTANLRKGHAIELTPPLFQDDEMQCIQNLIESAVLDPNVKGGLRWPLGKATSGDRFSVCGVWHTITKAYTNPSIRLKVRHADRFDFRTSMGESASEVYLKLKGIVSLLKMQSVDIGLISRMLEGNLKLIWDHFLNCDHFLG